MTAARRTSGGGFTALGAAAREKLMASAEFLRLRDAQHELAAGAVLTSVSNVPFEMSFRCTRCTEVFWFENLSWREGGFVEWRLSTEPIACSAAALVWMVADHAVRMHP